MASSSSRDVGFASVQGASETKLHQSGMKKTMPNATDASTKCKGPNVREGATRDSVAKSHSIGGRVA